MRDLFGEGPPPGCSVLEVRDPREMAEDSALSHRLPPRERQNTYRLRDRSLWRSGTGPLLTRLAIRNIDDLIILAWNCDRYGSDIGLNGPGLPRHCVGLMDAGPAAVTARGVTTVYRGQQGVIYRGDSGTRVQTSDRSRRFNFWICARRLDRTLAALSGEAPRQPLVFAPALDTSAEAAAPLMRLLYHLVEDLRTPDGGLASNPVALASFADLVADTMLRRLPHNYSAALARGREHTAIPAHLRRAEAFMEAYADAALSLDAVAAASGCSLRSLHLLFRRFRGSTPHAALQALRLERARAALLAEPEAPLAAVVRRFGFTNATRFREAYARRSPRRLRRPGSVGRSGRWRAPVGRCTTRIRADHGIRRLTAACRVESQYDGAGIVLIFIQCHPPAPARTPFRAAPRSRSAARSP